MPEQDNLINPETMQYYPEQVNRRTADAQDVHLDLSQNSIIVVDVPNINLYPNEEYAMIRRKGLGGSDASVVLGVNPFKNREELIREKVSTTLSEEEKAIGENVAVRKGLDLESLIINKFEKYFKQDTVKPVDMYRMIEYPFLKINYDGVTGTAEQYIPTEIKVVTSRGEKHYNLSKVMFNELQGFLPIPEDPSEHNWSIETKAGYYGIPPYYYTQLQQEMMGFGAPFGYLAVLTDRDWRFHTFFIWRDERVQNAIITEGWKVWQKIEALRGVV